MATLALTWRFSRLWCDRVTELRPREEPLSPLNNLEALDWRLAESMRRDEEADDACHRRSGGMAEEPTR